MTTTRAPAPGYRPVALLLLGLAIAVAPPAAARPAAAQPAAQDTVLVEASLSTARAQVGEAFVLQISVQTGGASPRRVEAPAPPPGLDIVRTQDYSELQFALPGGRQRRFRREIVLVGRVPGSYTLPPARVDVEGRVHTTQPLTITIEQAGTYAAPDAIVAGRPRLHVRAEPDTVYTGQQVLLRMEALIPEGTRPRRGRAPVFDAPTPAGVWAQELPQSRHSTVRLIGPDVVEVHEFSRALFPISAGPLTLPPAALVYEARMGVFGGVQTQRVESDSIRLTVLPLPAADRPSGFRGAVGKYTLSAQLEPATVRAGEPATLTVEIRGEGNVKGLPAPALPPIPHVDVLGAPEESETWPSDGVIHGARRFRWYLVPERDGTLEIDPIEYSFFDPFERRYEEASTERLRLVVTPGPSAGDGRDRGPTAPPPALRRRPAPDRLGWVRSPIFALAQLAPLLALLGMVARQRLRRRREVAAPRRPRAHLTGDWRRRLAEPALEPESLLHVFTRSLAGLLGGKAAEFGTADGLERAFAEHGLPAALARRAGALLHALEAHRFGGLGWDAEAARRLRAEAEAVLACVESAIRPGPGATSGPGARRKGGSAATLRALLAGALLAAAPGTVAAQTEGDAGLAAFASGVAAFDAGDYPSALRAFESATAERPRDASAWYNLGSAREATGDRGGAVAAWLRVVQLDPRATDVRARLDQAGAGAARRAMSPPLGLRSELLLLIAAALWWGGLGAAALARWSGRRAAAWASAASATALLALGAATLQQTHARRATVIPLEDPTLVRAAPTLRAETLYEAPAFRPLRVLERRGAWLRVRVDGREGWIEGPATDG